MWPFDSENREMYEQYAESYDSGDVSTIDTQEAHKHVRQFVENAPPEHIQRVFHKHFERLGPEERFQIAQHFPPEYGVDPNDSYSMAQGMARLRQERPDLFHRIIAHPVLLAGVTGLAALIAKHMLKR